MITKDPTTPELRRYSTFAALPCEILLPALNIKIYTVA